MSYGMIDGIRHKNKFHRYAIFSYKLSIKIMNSFVYTFGCAYVYFMWVTCMLHLMGDKVCINLFDFISLCVSFCYIKKSIQKEPN